MGKGLIPGAEAPDAGCLGQECHTEASGGKVRAQFKDCWGTIGQLSGSGAGP